eukprot:11198407-Lingulodinium_polyedra.AAC.1
MEVFSSGAAAEAVASTALQMAGFRARIARSRWFQLIEDGDIEEFLAQEAGLNDGRGVKLQSVIVEAKEVQAPSLIGGIVGWKRW